MKLLLEKFIDTALQMDNKNLSELTREELQVLDFMFYRTTVSWTGIKWKRDTRTGTHVAYCINNAAITPLLKTLLSNYSAPKGTVVFIDKDIDLPTKVNEVTPSTVKTHPRLNTLSILETKGKYMSIYFFPEKVNKTELPQDNKYPKAVKRSSDKDDNKILTLEFIMLGIAYSSLTPSTKANIHQRYIVQKYKALIQQILVEKYNIQCDFPTITLPANNYPPANTELNESQRLVEIVLEAKNYLFLE